MTLSAGIVLAAGGMLAGCQGGGSGGSGYTDPLYHAWYSVYKDAYGQDHLTYCKTGYPEAGCDFYADGSKITATEDYYYSDSAWNSQVEYAHWTYTDSYGNPATYDGWAWLSQSGILYDEYGNALNEEGQSESRDMMADVAQQEEKVVRSVGKAFARKYKLKDEVGLKIARTLNDWATLGKKRGRTDADVAEFAQRLYGVSVDKALAALSAAQTGDSSGVEALNQQIAVNWGTDPETSKEILKSWYKDQLSEAGQ